MKRTASLKRQTSETNVNLALNLDKHSPVKIDTTIPFMDHMLNLFAAHAGISLTIKASGDTYIDDHHLVEDIGITLGKAIKTALSARKGIVRYGHFLLPMDEALAYVALDLSNRFYLSYEVNIKFQKTGFDYDLLHEFFYALAANAGITLHIKMLKGRNNHHIAESIFKGFGRAFGAAISKTKSKSVPSTKGVL
ncbi:MAG: imidazoleglycerol-phosphate dehydratase HisB [Elusimicrobia bacterium]|nr:imidazoleglycerol-phosphate dehydratase HisB [Elusimicrobiota bacterium]